MKHIDIREHLKKIIKKKKKKKKNRIYKHWRNTSRHFN